MSSIRSRSNEERELSKSKKFWIPVIALGALSLAACEVETKQGNYQVSAQRNTLQVAKVQKGAALRGAQAGVAGGLKAKQKLSSKGPHRLSKTAMPQSVPEQHEQDKSNPNTPSPSPDEQKAMTSPWDGGFDPWAESKNGSEPLPNPTPSPSPSSEELALLDKPTGDPLDGFNSFSSGDDATQTEDQLEKYQTFLRQLADPVSGELLYPYKESGEEFNDLAAQKAAEFVRDQVPFDGFNAAYNHFSWVIDPDMQQDDKRIFKGTLAVDKAQDLASRKTDQVVYENTSDYLQKLKDRDSRYVMTVQTAVQIAIELSAAPGFNLETFIAQWQEEVQNGAAPEVPLVNTVIQKIGVSVDWSKINPGPAE